MEIICIKYGMEGKIRLSTTYCFMVSGFPVPITNIKSIDGIMFIKKEVFN